MAKTPKEELENKNTRDALVAQQKADDAFAQGYFKLLQAKNSQKPRQEQNQSLIELLKPNLKVQNPSAEQIEEAKKEALEKIKSNTPITLKVKDNQTLVITFAHTNTSFVFATESQEGRNDSVDFILSFEEAFKQEHNDQKPYYQLIAYDKESLKETLRSLLAKGIKVDEITLYEEGVKRELSQEEVIAFYAKLNEPDSNPPSQFDQRSSRCSIL